MKIFITLFLTAVIGFVIYMKYDTHTFVKNLPPVPSVQSVETTTDEEQIFQSQVGDKTGSTEQFTERANMDAIQDSHSHDRTDNHSQSSDMFDVSNIRDGVEDDGNLSDSTEEIPDKDKKLRNQEIIEMFKNPYERIKLMKPWLLQTYGDTPEVNTFLELELKIATADTHTIEEAIKRAELAAKFYPTPENQRSLETTKRMAAHATNGIFINPRKLPSNMRIIRKEESNHD